MCHATTTRVGAEDMARAGAVAEGGDAYACCEFVPDNPKVHAKPDKNKTSVPDYINAWHLRVLTLVMPI